MSRKQGQDGEWPKSRGRTGEYPQDGGTQRSRGGGDGDRGWRRESGGPRWVLLDSSSNVLVCEGQESLKANMGSREAFVFLRKMGVFEC